MSKVVKKITKPISKVLDKIVPNEIKPFLPYVAAAVPFLAPASFGAGAGLGGLLKRGLLTGALPNTLAQLAQEGNEGELNMLSTLMATGAGAMTAGGAGDTLRGMMDPGKAVPIPGGSMPGQGIGGFKYDPSGISGLGKAKNFLLKGAGKLADAAGGARDVLQNPFEESVKLSDIGKAAAFPVSQATGDLAYAEGVKALKEFNAAEAAKQVAEAAQKAGMDQEYIDSITSSMGDYGYDQVDIDEILRIHGLFASGGRVGFAMGGGEFNEPDFISMREVVENVDGDEMMEGIMAAGYNKGGSVLPQGMEMDYRGGGMIPMGSAERADDVPARVSKNEFVMTADAVRAAGGGSVNKGAQRMYNLMNNLEARS